MVVDAALITVILTLISLFTLVSRVKWLVRIGKVLLLLALIYGVIFIDPVREFFLNLFGIFGEALSKLFGGMA